MIKEGANVNAANSFGNTALIWASRNGRLDIVNELIKSGADVNTTDNFGYTALIYASSDGRLDIVKELIKTGANVNAASEDGNTALIAAYDNGHIEVVNLLTAINVEENQEEFINQSDEIKNILINRWINLYKENRSKLLIDRLKMAGFYAKENEKAKIGELLSKLDIDRQNKGAEKFADVIVKTVR